MSRWKKIILLIISSIIFASFFRKYSSDTLRNVCEHHKVYGYPITYNLKLDDKCDGLCAENFYHKYVSKADSTCATSTRIGSGGEGGWELCIVDSLLPRSPCLIYSFGIRENWSFDDVMSTKYNCTVRAFDPSIKTATSKRNTNLWFFHEGVGGSNMVDEKNWTLSTIRTLRQRFNEVESVIDYLKIDIEYNEWAVLATAIEDGSLLKVKQIGLEIHTKEMSKIPTKLEDYRIYVPILLRLEGIGFKRWHWHLNPQSTKAISPYSSKEIMCCYEFIYYNVKYATLPDIVKF